MSKVSARKSSDMGIDGYIFEGHPIQAKQPDDIRRNVINNLTAKTCSQNYMMDLMD
jgi:hypothetical protein